MNLENVAFIYAPIIYMDENEPFKVKKVGFKKYAENGVFSDSFNRRFDFENYPGTEAVYEYAYYLDYDIQHLYDLEHIWVYVDEKGEIAGAEGSYHGRLLRAYSRKESTKAANGDYSAFAEIKDGHVVMYSQPGKHAMLANPSLMFLYPELFEACKRLAGISGLDAPEKFLTDIHISEEDNRRVVEHIRSNYSFEPKMEFEEYLIPKEDYMSWDELDKKIPEYIKAELEKLGISYS